MAWLARFAALGLVLVVTGLPMCQANVGAGYASVFGTLSGERGRKVEAKELSSVLPVKLTNAAARDGHAGGVSEEGNLVLFDSSRSHVTMRRASGLPSFLSLSLAPTHALAISLEGHVYSWGQNITGQLGTPAAPPPSPSPTASLHPPSSATASPSPSPSVSTGPNNARSSEHGDVFFGNTHDGTAFWSAVPARVEFPEAVDAVQACGGVGFSVVLDRSGVVWGFGRLPGASALLSSAPTPPTKLDVAPCAACVSPPPTNPTTPTATVCQISCGDAHVGFVLSDGSLLRLAQASNSSSSSSSPLCARQCAHVTHEAVEVCETQSDERGGDIAAMLNGTVRGRAAGAGGAWVELDGLGGEGVVQVAAGADGVMALTSSSRLLRWDFGNAGGDNHTQGELPTAHTVAMPPHFTPHSLFAGDGVTVVLTTGWQSSLCPCRGAQRTLPAREYEKAKQDEHDARQLEGDLALAKAARARARAAMEREVRQNATRTTLPAAPPSPHCPPHCPPIPLPSSPDNPSPAPSVFNPCSSLYHGKQKCGTLARKPFAKPPLPGEVVPVSARQVRRAHRWQPEAAKLDNAVAAEGSETEWEWEGEGEMDRLLRGAAVRNYAGVAGEARDEDAEGGGRVMTAPPSWPRAMPEEPPTTRSSPPPVVGEPCDRPRDLEEDDLAVAADRFTPLARFSDEFPPIAPPLVQERDVGVAPVDAAVQRGAGSPLRVRP